MLDRYNALINKAKEEDLELIMDSVESMANYFNKVICMQSRIAMARARLEGDELRNAIMRIDAERREAHIAMTMGVNILNALCDEYGIARIFNIARLNAESSDDRDKAAVACFALCVKLYLGNMTHCPDTLVELDKALDSMIASNTLFNTKK